MEAVKSTRWCGDGRRRGWELVVRPAPPTAEGTMMKERARWGYEYDGGEECEVGWRLRRR